MRSPCLSLPAVLLALATAPALAQTGSHNPVGTPDLSTCPTPVYPDGAAARKAEGTTRMAFLVGADGVVRSAKVLRSSGSLDLDEAARTALVKCRFHPGAVDGTPVEAWTQLAYVWMLQRSVTKPENTP